MQEKINFYLFLKKVNNSITKISTFNGSISKVTSSKNWSYKDSIRQIRFI